MVEEHHSLKLDLETLSWEQTQRSPVVEMSLGSLEKS